MPRAKEGQQKVPILKKTTALCPSWSHYSICATGTRTGRWCGPFSRSSCHHPSPTVSWAVRWPPPFSPTCRRSPARAPSGRLRPRRPCSTRGKQHYRTWSRRTGSVWGLGEKQGFAFQFYVAKYLKKRKMLSSYCQTRMRCGCVSELACMRVVITFETGKHSVHAFSYKASGGLIHACINLSCSEQWCFRGSQTRMHKACVSDRMMIYVSLRWAPSLNDRSKLQ